MARMRTVKPGLRTSRVVASWPFEVRYFWVLLWGYLDDKGRGLDIPKTIAGDCYPHDDRITPAVIGKWLTLMATTKIEPDSDPPLCRYEVAGRRYIHCPNWKEHQRPNRPQPSVHPPCPVHPDPHDRRTEPFTESDSEPDTTDDVNDSVPGIRGFEGLKGRGAASESLREPPPPEPPRRCRTHRDDPDPPSCRRCGEAREASERWRADRRAETAAAAQCPDHPGQLAHNCGGCRGERLGGAA
jgi:hypothetical protein